MNATFEIAGIPQGKGRHRVQVVNGRVHTYTPERTASYENLVKLEYKRQCPNIYFVGELSVGITAYYPIPNSWSRKKRQDAIDGKIRPQIKPDVDNVSKIVLDSLNNIAYDDDKQIVDLVIHKYYSEIPYVSVSIIEYK